MQSLADSLPLPFDAAGKGPANRTAARGEKLIVFCIAEQRYAIPLAAVQEVLPLPLLSRSPRMPSILAGFMHLGGMAVAIVDVARLFDMPSADCGLYTPLLLLRGATDPIALKVERVLGIVSVLASAKVRVEERNDRNNCLEATAIIEGHVVALLSLERLLLSRERKCLAHLRADEQSRIDALCETAP